MEVLNTRNFIISVFFLVSLVYLGNVGFRRPVTTDISHLSQFSLWNTKQLPYGECIVPWTNSIINSTDYEKHKLVLPELLINGELPPPVSVDPLYPDPIVKLRSDYFVLPQLQNGPNNQLIGLREVIFLAMKLNRTLVLPKFFKHHTDNGTIRSVSPLHRLQVSDLCNFISCVTLQQFRRACGYKLNGLLHTRHWSKPYWKQVQKYYGMESDLSGRSTELVPPESFTGDARHYRGSEIQKIFSSEAKCVVFARPLYNLHYSKKDQRQEANLLDRNIDLDKMPEVHLWRLIAFHTRSPQYIINIAREFANTVMAGKPYLSIHWRYQPEEFMQRCFHRTLNNPVKKIICENALNIKPIDIATAIEDRMLQVTPGKLKYIYFATPSSERRILEDVAKRLYDKHGWLTYSFLDLDKFLSKRLEFCPDLQIHYNDILSTTEMEICTFASAFLGSQRSTWSDVVHMSRLTSQEISTSYDGDIFKLSLDALRERQRESEKT